MSSKENNVQVLGDTGVDVGVSFTLDKNDIIEAKVTQYKTEVRALIKEREEEMTAAAKAEREASDAVEAAVRDLSKQFFEKVVKPDVSRVMRALGTPAKRQKSILANIEKTTVAVHYPSEGHARLTAPSVSLPCTKSPKVPWTVVDTDDDSEHLFGPELQLTSWHVTISTPTDLAKAAAAHNKAQEKLKEATEAVAKARLKLSQSEVDYIRDKVREQVIGALYKNSGMKGKQLLGMLKEADVKQLTCGD